MAFFMGLANGVMIRVMKGLLGVIGMELAGEGEGNSGGGGLIEMIIELEVGTRLSLLALGLLVSLRSRSIN